MKYRTYPLNLERLTRLARKAGVVGKGQGTEGIRSVMSDAYGAMPGLIQTMDFIIHSEEWHWLTSDKVVYYPGSLDLARSLMSAKFSASDAAAFYDGFESFILAFPEGVFFDGKPAQPCLVTICLHKQRSLNFLSKFGQAIGVGKINVAGRQMDEDGYSIAINYMDHTNPALIIRMCLASDMLPRVLACESLQEHIDAMGELNEFAYVGNMDLDGTDHAYQYELTRFILRFLMYKKALPERIIDGLPGVGRKEVETPMAMGRTHRIIQAPARTHDAPEAHYRSWHFRQLSHERYYRGEHKKSPPGSRVVFVSDAYVGRKVTAKTAT